MTEFQKEASDEGSNPPMDIYEKRFQAIEQDLAVMNSRMDNFATKTDLAELKFSMLLTSIGIVVSTVTILTAIEAVF